MTSRLRHWMGWLPLCWQAVVACAPFPSPNGQADAGNPPDAAVVYDATRFVTEVVTVTYGEHAGFGQGQMPAVVLGPPMGRGAAMGGLDVVSLGLGGSITLRLGQDVVDGPGPDFTVFENAFTVANGTQTFAEPARVEVSADGVTYAAFACNPDGGWPFAGCAGVQPVLTPGPDGSLSPLDPTRSGGDHFDLADVAVSRARFIRITDVSMASPESNNAGFDLDAVAILSTAPGQD